MVGLLRDVARRAGPDGAIWTDTNPYLPATVRGDVEALRQLLLELASNAVRYGGRQTRIYAERIGGFIGSPFRIRFTVADDGPGLPAGRSGSLSTRPERLPRKPTQIGLFLACCLARRLDAALTVVQSDGRGTIIRFDACSCRTRPGRPSRSRPRPASRRRPLTSC